MIPFNSQNSNENFKSLILAAVYGGWRVMSPDPRKGYDKNDICFGRPYTKEDGTTSIEYLAIDSNVAQNEEFYRLQMSKIESYSDAPIRAPFTIDPNKLSYAKLDPNFNKNAKALLELNHPGETISDERLRNVIALYSPKRDDFYAKIDMCALEASVLACDILNNPQFKAYHEVLPEFINDVNKMLTGELLEDAHQWGTGNELAKVNPKQLAREVDAAEAAVAAAQKRYNSEEGQPGEG